MKEIVVQKHYFIPLKVRIEFKGEVMRVVEACGKSLDYYLLHYERPNKTYPFISSFSLFPSQPISSNILFFLLIFLNYYTKIFFYCISLFYKND